MRLGLTYKIEYNTYLDPLSGFDTLTKQIAFDLANIGFADNMLDVFTCPAEKYSAQGVADLVAKYKPYKMKVFTFEIDNIKGVK